MFNEKQHLRDENADSMRNKNIKLLKWIKI